MPGIDHKLSERLTRAGLQEKESVVYSALLQMGSGSPSAVARATGLNRTTVYAVLETLAIRGLVSELQKRNKLYYQIERPAKLERFAETQIKIAEERLENIRQIVPDLEGLYSLAPNKPVVKFFEGSEGVLSVYRDHVDVEKSYEQLSFSNTSDLMQFLSEDFRNEYIRKKQRIGITTRAILPDTETDINYTESIYSKFSTKIWPQLRHVPRKNFPFKSDLTIYGTNKVSIINFNEPQSAAVIIEDQTIHDMMVMIFELAWKGATLPSPSSKKSKNI